MAGASAGPYDLATALREALAPHPWRRMAPVALARLAVGAADRYAVAGFVAGVPGIALDSVAALEPAEADDLRVTAVTRHLDGRRWRLQRVDRLCAELAAALGSWQAEREAFHATLRGLSER